MSAASHLAVGIPMHNTHALGLEGAWKEPTAHRRHFLLRLFNFPTSSDLKRSLTYVFSYI
jgi:hypothetical protein